MNTSKYVVLTAATALTLALSPMLIAQEATGPDPSQNARSTNSTADQHADQNGSSASQPGTLGKNNSKDPASERRDPNPGTIPSDSAEQSSTKNPGGNNTSAAETQDASNETRRSDKLSDNEFIHTAAQGGMTEVQLGKVANEKGSSDQVKNFGARMVKDHTQANEELLSIAHKKGVTVPDSLDAKHQAMVDHLSRLSGTDFDKAYINGMVRDHEKTVALFKEEAQSGQDPDLQAYASKTLPVLEDHCSTIKSIRDKETK